MRDILQGKEVKMLLEAPKNIRVRKVMAENGIDQRKLSSVLGWNEMKTSIVLNACELARFEQDEIIRAIRESQA